MTLRSSDIEAAQKSWGRAVVEVGAATSWEGSHARAETLVREHYRVDDGSLLFRPTKAEHNQFRRTLKDAVSYFVGRDSDHPADRGFALEPWTSVRFDNAGIVIRGDLGIAMGTYYFGRADGSELEVEYSFVYSPATDGRLLIQLHHSALPYRP